MQCYSVKAAGEGIVHVRKRIAHFARRWWQRCAKLVMFARGQPRRMINRAISYRTWLRLEPLEDRQLLTVLMVDKAPDTQANDDHPIAPAAALPNNPDLVYNPITGHLRIDNDGENVVSFFIQSAGQFLSSATDFDELDAHVGAGTSIAVDNTPSQIGWASAVAIADQGFGIYGPDLANLGAILPTGLNQAGFETLITGQKWSRSGVIGAFDFVLSEGPRVTKVLVGNATWSADYKALIPGADPDGYLIPHGTDQTKTLPWRNIREVIVAFDQPVKGSGVSGELLPADFQLNGINNGSITILTPVDYDDTTNRAKLTLATNLRQDRYVLKVDASKVSDLAGNALDGEFTKHQLGPSGDAIPGGSLLFDFNVMPGDFNRNGNDVIAPTVAVDSSDLSILGASWMETHVDPFYRWNADANGDLRNDSSDLSVLGSHWMLSLPEPALGPQATALAPAAVFVAAAVDDDRAEAIVDGIFAVGSSEDDMSVAHGLTDALVDGVLLAKRKRRELLLRRGAAENVSTTDEQSTDGRVASDIREGFFRLHW